MENLRDLMIASVFAVLIAIQEFILSGIPNVSLTFLLIVILTRLVSFEYSVLSISTFVLIDNLLMGSLMINYIVPMLVSYLLLIIIMELLFSKRDNEIMIGILGFIFGIIYTLMFAVTDSLIFDIDIIKYLIAGSVFTLVLCINNFLTIVWLYKPIINRLQQYISEEDINGYES